MQQFDWPKWLSLGGRIFFSNGHLFKYVFGKAAFRGREVRRGNSRGPSVDGFDICLHQLEGEDVLLPGEFKLGVACEFFRMPKTYRAVVHDKSSLARRGISVQNSVIEPGWKGFLTLELHNQSLACVEFGHGDPIAQVCFVKCNFWLWKALGLSPVYKGKYQKQMRRPQPWLLETPAPEPQSKKKGD